MKIWWQLSEYHRKKLALMQRRLFQTELNPPAEESGPPVKVKGAIESPGEIDRLMRQAPSKSRGKDES
jgi:hypothetical protein